MVLRVDSGGGDALASDLMWREIRALARDKPVIASMSDVAASGGACCACCACCAAALLAVVWMRAAGEGCAGDAWGSELPCRTTRLPAGSRLRAGWLSRSCEDRWTTQKKVTQRAVLAYTYMSKLSCTRVEHAPQLREKGVLPCSHACRLLHEHGGQEGGGRGADRHRQHRCAGGVVV